MLTWPSIVEYNGNLRIKKTLPYTGCGQSVTKPDQFPSVGKKEKKKGPFSSDGIRECHSAHVDNNHTAGYAKRLSYCRSERAPTPRIAAHAKFSFNQSHVHINLNTSSLPITLTVILITTEAPRQATPHHQVNPSLWHSSSERWRPTLADKITTLLQRKRKPIFTIESQCFYFQCPLSVLGVSLYYFYEAFPLIRLFHFTFLAVLLVHIFCGKLPAPSN